MLFNDDTIKTLILYLMLLKGRLLMKPLSVIYYSLKNKRKLISMMISIGFSVALIYSMQLLIDQVKHSNYYTTLAPLEDYSEVMCKNNQPLSDEIITKIINDDSTLAVIPRICQQTFYYPIAGRNAVGVYALNSEDLTFMMERLGLELIEGRLPQEGAYEAIMDYRLALNKGLDIGDYIGYEVSEEEIQIPGSYEIVGLTDGKSITMLVSRNDNLEDYSIFSEGMIVFHKDGQRQLSNTFLESFPNDNVKVNTYHLANQALQKDTQDIKKYMNILVGVLIIVLSISAGNSSYINTFQRRYEFSLLNAVGYTPLQVLKKASLEIFFINILGYLLGALLTMILAMIQYSVVFQPNGLVMRLVQPDAIAQTLAIPIFTSLFSIIPVSRMMRKIDPIQIIEGVE